MLNSFTQECKECGYCCNTLDVLILKPDVNKPLKEILYNDLTSTKQAGCSWRINNICTTSICSLQKPSLKFRKAFIRLFIRWHLQHSKIYSSYKDRDGNCKMKQMNIIIKDATENNIQDILNIYKLAFKEVADRFKLHQIVYYPVNFTEQKIQQEMQKGKIAIVFDGSKPIATQTRQPKLNRICFLDHLSVIPSYQKKGISKQLFDYQHKKLKEEGFLYAEAYVIKEEHKKILNYYKRLGYKIIHEFTIETFPTEILHLRKEI